jgi:hypothetical protein
LKIFHKNGSFRPITLSFRVSFGVLALLVHRSIPEETEKRFVKKGSVKSLSSGRSGKTSNVIRFWPETGVTLDEAKARFTKEKREEWLDLSIGDPQTKVEN